MKHVAVPEWILRAKDGTHFLIGIEPNGTVRSDGGHSEPAGVAKAKRLHERIAVIAAPEGTHWCMITVSDVPNVDVSVNEEAIAILNHPSHRLTRAVAEGGE